MIPVIVDLLSTFAREKGAVIVIQRQDGSIYPCGSTCGDSCLRDGRTKTHAYPFKTRGRNDTGSFPGRGPSPFPSRHRPERTGCRGACRDESGSDVRMREKPVRPGI